MSRRVVTVHQAVQQGARRVIPVDGGRADELWWEGQDGWPGRDGDLDDLDAAAVALHPYARQHQSDLVLHGRVARSRLANLDENQDVWQRWQPGPRHHTTLYADEVVEDGLPRGRVGMLAFSGGVDACYSLVAHADGRLGHRTVDVRRAVLLLGMDLPLHDVVGARQAARSAGTILAEFGTALTILSTNWRDAWSPSYPMSFVNGVVGSLRAIARPDERIVISSGAAYEDSSAPYGQNPITDRLLGQRAHPVWPVGRDCDRVEKCRAVGEHEVVRHHVRVCWQPDVGGRNCGRCEKCVRTKLAFAAAGVGEIPALGPLTDDQVAAIPLKGPVAARQLRGVLAHEQELGARLARAVRTRLGGATDPR